MRRVSAKAGIGKPFAGNADDKPYEPENLKKALDDGLPVWTCDGTASSDDAAAGHGLRAGVNEEGGIWKADDKGTSCHRKCEN